MLGFKSLGIVDFPEQPYRHENSALVLFIWGEFYQSSGDLTKIAAQLVNCYRTDDWRQLRTLNGLFSFALWDSNERRLALGSDIYASRPLFYHHSNTDFTFGPSPFAVAAATGEKQIDAATLSQFLSFGLVAGDITWFENVKRLRAGHVLTVDSSGLHHSRYYRPRFTPQRMSKRDAAAGLVERLETALGRVTGGRQALSLSGGGDSRLLAAVADRQQCSLPTFSFGESRSEDPRIAALVAKRFGCEHRRLDTRRDYLSSSLRDCVLHTHGQVAAVNFHGFSTRSQVKESADICLTGLWGNNHLGYQSFRQRLIRRIKTPTRFRDFLCRSLGSGFRPSSLHSLVKRTEVASPFTLIDSLIEEFGQSTYLETLLAIDCFELNSVRSLAGWWLENDQLEFRSPYCDYDLMRFSLSIPSQHKLLMGVGRQIWRRHFPEAAKIPYQRTGLPLSASVSRIIYQRLRDQMRGATRPPGILDYEDAFREDLRDWLQDTLDSPNSRLQTILEPKLIASILKDHLEDRADNAEKIGLLLTIEQVLRLIEEL
jgi:asparagine synthetase B (glutamine-hydrolysing)